MNDRLLRVTVILSVFALIGMAGAGTVAAQENFEVSDLNVNDGTNDQGPNASVQSDDPLTVTANVTNVGNQTGQQEVSFRLNASGAPLNRPAIVESQMVNLTNESSTTVSFLGGQTPNDLNLQPGMFDHGVLSVNDTTNDTVNGSALGTLEVADPGNSSFIRGNILDQAGDPINGISDPNTDPVVGIRIIDTDAGVLRQPDDTSGSDIIEGSNGDFWFVPQDDDFYQREVPIFGQNTTYRLEAAVFNFNETSGVFEEDTQGFEDFSPKSKVVEADTTENFEITLVELVVPQEIQAVPSSSSAIADGQDTIKFTVTVIGDNDEPLPDADVDVSQNGEPGTVFIDGNATSSFTDTTNENGTFMFDVTSNVSQSVEFTFTDPTGEAPPEDVPVNFVLSGEGTVSGTVFDVDRSDSGVSDRALEDARIWAVQKDTFLQNSINVSAPANASETYFYRVRDNETGRILDVTQDYRIDNNGTNVNLSISDIRELNTTDASEGSGFAVRANDANASDAFATPLEPGVYDIERSETAPNEEDGRFGDESNPEENFTTTKTVEVSTDLTFEAAQERSARSGQQLNDTTDAQGDYVLDRLFTDFQAGVDYTIAANKPGYEIDFIDPLVTEEGALFEPGEDENFELRQTEIEADSVDVTQVGTHPPLDETGGTPNTSLIEPFEDQTDATFQDVPRDGTVDVIQVDTGVGQPDGSVEPLGAEVTVSFADTVGGDADFLDTVNLDTDDDNTLVSSGNETITIDTGDDGTATVLFEATRGGTVRTQKIAELADLADSDTSNVTFRRVDELESASISGFVSDSEDTPLPGSPVWASTFTVQDPGTVAPNDEPERIRISPDTSATPGTQAFADAVDEDSDEFNVELQDFNTTSGEFETLNSDTATAAELREYEFDAFPSISAQDTFKLFQFASDGDATYSLEPTPALGSTGPVDPDTDYRIRSVRVEGNNVGVVSNDALVTIQPATTGTANVVIPITVDEGDDGGGDGNVSGVDQYREDPNDPNSDVSTGGLQEAINDFVNEDIDTGLLQDVINEFLASQ